MLTDSINVEILRIKRQLAAKHDNQIDRIVADARSRQTNAVSRSPRRFKSEPFGQIDPQSTGVHDHLVYRQRNRPSSAIYLEFDAKERCGLLTTHRAMNAS